MKKTYTPPTLHTETFAVDDVITASVSNIPVVNSGMNGMEVLLDNIANMFGGE